MYAVLLDLFYWWFLSANFTHVVEFTFIVSRNSNMAQTKVTSTVKLSASDGLVEELWMAKIACDDMLIFAVPTNLLLQFSATK